MSSHMSKTFGLTYNVRESELIQGRDRETLIKRTNFTPLIKKSPKLIKCNIKFLDNSKCQFEVDVS